MKKAIIISIVIFIAISVKSQVYETWSAPIALTDSSSFNSNPEVVVLNANESYMFYEKKQSQSGNREIWWKKISGSMSDEQMLIGGYPEADYRNPKIVNYNFLVFECNATNNDQYDLFGVKFDENGLVGNSFKLTNTDYDENSFYGESYSGICCWESEGDIIVANIQNSQDTLQLTNIEIIDTVNCFDPVCKDGFISWRKVEDNESHIYYSEIDWPSTEWSAPDTIFQTNDNINLSLSKSLYGFEGRNLCWQGSGKIYFSDTPNGYIAEISSPEILGIDNYYEPTAFNLEFITDYSPELYSFAGEAGPIRDIYIKVEMFSDDVINITDDTLKNKNPKLFYGGGNSYSYNVHNIWQTEINDFDVLYMSMASYLFGAIKENDAFRLEISPNPVSNNQNITISSPENISIYSAQIYSVSGELILKTGFDSHSSNYEINMRNTLPGVSFIKIQTSKGEVTRKLIKK